MSPQSKYRYSWKPDVPDHRDVMFYCDPCKEKPPQVVDLRHDCPSVADQSTLGSCTANALAGAMEFMRDKTATDYTPYSRLFIYYNEREIEGNINDDSGAMIRTGVKTLAKFGVCPESVWPYDISKFTDKPDAESFEAAGFAKITSYFRLTTLDDMLRCLADGFPFVFGFNVYGSFESEEVATSGISNMPILGETMQGGHAVCAVGYDLTTRRFLVRNSWGDTWGQKGYFTIPFEYLTDRNLSDDFWTLRK